MSILFPSKASGRAVSLVGMVIGIALLAGVVQLYNRHVAADALLAASLVQSERRADSLSRVVRVDRVALDRALAAARPDSQHLARIMPRVRIRTPTVIDVNAASVDTMSLGGHPAPAPPLEVHVPVIITDLVQTQARRIAQLESALRLAEQGWQHERALRAEREHEIVVLERQHPRVGLKTGIVLGAIGTALLVRAIVR